MSENDALEQAYQNGYEAGKKSAEGECCHNDGDSVTVCGVPLSPCGFKETERYRNVTVSVCQCEKCGKVRVSWESQENTERIDEI